MSVADLRSDTRTLPPPLSPFSPPPFATFFYKHYFSLASPREHAARLSLSLFSSSLSLFSTHGSWTISILDCFPVFFLFPLFSLSFPSRPYLLSITTPPPFFLPFSSRFSLVAAQVSRMGGRERGGSSSSPPLLFYFFAGIARRKEKNFFFSLSLSFLNNKEEKRGSFR